MKNCGGQHTGRHGCLFVSHLRDRLARARFFRGHGVHSPFVYTIVRQVFMCSRPLSDDCRLYESLVAAGVARKQALQLQNMFTHCGYGCFATDDVSADADMVVLTRDFPSELLDEACENAKRRGTTLAVMSPDADCVRSGICRRIVGRHSCTTIDKRHYLLIFNNYLPKQHFRL